MNEIAAKLADALAMFWQSLDEQERRLLMIGVLWLAAALVSVPLERSRKERERQELVEAVAERMSRGG